MKAMDLSSSSSNVIGHTDAIKRHIMELELITSVPDETNSYSKKGDHASPAKGTSECFGAPAKAKYDSSPDFHSCAWV